MTNWIGFALGIGSAVIAFAGTAWSKRRSGPDMTSVVLSSIQAHQTRLDREIDQLRHELELERLYVLELVDAMTAAGVPVPPRPERNPE